MPQHQISVLSFIPWRFSLAALLKFTTICAILAALSSRIGLPAAMLLAAMALSLGARLGPLAICALGAALIAAHQPAGLGQVLVILAAAGLCAWYRIDQACFQRGKLSDRRRV